MWESSQDAGAFRLGQDMQCSQTAALHFPLTGIQRRFYRIFSISLSIYSFVPLNCFATLAGIKYFLFVILFSIYFHKNQMVRISFSHEFSLCLLLFCSCISAQFLQNFCLFQWPIFFFGFCFVLFCFSKSQEYFKLSEYHFLISDMPGKYLLTSCGLSIHFLNSFNTFMQSSL